MSSGKSSRRSSVSSILDAFGLPVPGRDSPGRLRRNLSMPNSDDNGALLEVGRGPLPADLNADPVLNPTIHYKYTKRDPMGGIILDLFGEVVMLANKSNKAMTADIDDICQRSHNHREMGGKMRDGWLSW